MHSSSLWISAILLSSELAYFVGQSNGRTEVEERHECHTTQSRPCEFAPGIVGVQTCGWADEWETCEPDPRYRVTY